MPRLATTVRRRDDFRRLLDAVDSGTVPDIAPESRDVLAMCLEAFEEGLAEAGAAMSQAALIRGPTAPHCGVYVPQASADTQKARQARS